MVAVVLAVVAVTVFVVFVVVAVYDVTSLSNVGVRTNDPIANPDKVATEGAPWYRDPCNQRLPKVSHMSKARSVKIRASVNPAVALR